MQATNWNRKALLSSFEQSSPPLLLPALVLLFDLALFGASTALVLLASNLALKLVGMLAVTAAIVRLFLIGHDACHGSFFGSARLNAVCGRIAFLPSMTAFSLWEVGHNTAHHGFNNLKGRDQVWAPFSKAEFDRLPRVARGSNACIAAAAAGACITWSRCGGKSFFSPVARKSVRAGAGTSSTACS